MLRRIVRDPDEGIGHSLSGIVLPACASLVVPFLAITALELPAAAIDRIAAPLYGHVEQAPDVSGAPAGLDALPWSDRLYGLARVRPTPVSLSPLVADTDATSGAAEPASTDTETSWVDDWNDPGLDLPPSDVPANDGQPDTEGGSEDSPTGQPGAPGQEEHGGGGGAAPSDESGPIAHEEGAGEEEDGTAPTPGAGDGGAPGGDEGAAPGGDGSLGPGSGGAGGSDGSSGSQSPGPVADDDGPPGNSGNAPGQNKDGGGPGNSGNTPGHDDDWPGNSANAPGYKRGHQSS